MAGSVTDTVDATADADMTFEHKAQATTTVTGSGPTTKPPPLDVTKDGPTRARFRPAASRRTR